MPVNAKALLSARGITRSFGPVQVLFGIDFEVGAGEVHALLGENGAGKSTLVKILSGYLQPDSGDIQIAGKTAQLTDSGVAEARGIVLVHQEFNLAEQLSVEENIFLGREVVRGWFLDRASMRSESRRLLESLQCTVDPRTRVSHLSVSDKQMVEIAKAVSRDTRVLIMDEPTAVLTSSETEVLFRLIEELKARGVGIVYISHKLDEIDAIADRVTVLRDGQLITTRPTASLSQDDMARLMVGREISDMFPHRSPPPESAELVLEVQGFVVPGQIKGASFDLRRGEILGFAGLVGAGRTALMEAIVG